MARKTSQMTEGSTPKDEEGEDLDREFEEGADVPDGVKSRIEQLQEDADIDPKTQSFIMRQIYNTLKRLPGAEAMLRKNPAKRPQAAMRVTPALLAEIAKRGEEGTEAVAVSLARDGQLGGQYHSRLIHFTMPGTYKNVPAFLANRLAEDYPNDFSLE